MSNTENPPYASAADLLGLDDAQVALGAEIVTPADTHTGTENPPHDRGHLVVNHEADDDGSGPDGGGAHAAPVEAAPQSPEQAGALKAADVAGLTEQEVG